MSDELNNENTSELENNETQNNQKDSAETAESNNLTSIFKSPKDSNINTISSIICGIVVVVVCILVLFNINLKDYLSKWIDFSGLPESTTIVEETTEAEIVEEDLSNTTLTIQIIKDCGIVLFKDNKCVLVDCGNYNEELKSFLADNNIEKIDTLVISNNYKNRIGGVIDLATNITIDQVVFSMDNNTSSELFINTYNYLQTKVYDMQFGNCVIDLSNLAFDVCGLDSKYTDSSNKSNIVSLCYGDIRFAFLSDIGQSIEAINLERYNVIVYANSDIDKLIDKLNSEIIISETKFNDNYSLESNGSITITSDGKSLNIVTNK